MHIKSWEQKYSEFLQFDSNMPDVRKWKFRFNFSLKSAKHSAPFGNLSGKYCISYKYCSYYEVTPMLQLPRTVWVLQNEQRSNGYLDEKGSRCTYRKKFENILVADRWGGTFKKSGTVTVTYVTKYARANCGNSATGVCHRSCVCMRAFFCRAFEASLALNGTKIALHLRKEPNPLITYTKRE